MMRMKAKASSVLYGGAFVFFVFLKSFSDIGFRP